VSADLSGLFGEATAARLPAGTDELGGWRVADGKLEGSGDPVDALRLLTGVYWNGGEVTAGSDAARDLLSGWGL
jgi:hypothetical protein